ncbi:MAG: response regulator [Patescibacteria group bacterium]|nr:response regulator [Patescibacteria group bacterium]
MEEENKKKKILIAEDDEMLVEIYKKKFGNGEYDLTVTTDGKETIDKIRKIKPDVVLLDLVMPELDGFEVIKLIKQDPETKNIKIIVTSNLGQESEKAKAIKLGANEFLIKADYDLNELADKVKDYL